MTFDRLRHQLIASNTWLKTLFIGHYPSIWRLLEVLDIEMTHPTPAPLYCPVCFCWVIDEEAYVHESSLGMAHDQSAHYYASSLTIDLPGYT